MTDSNPVSSVDFVCLFLQEKCLELYVSHLLTSTSKVHKDGLSSNVADCIFSGEVLWSLVSDFHEDTSLVIVATQRMVSAVKSLFVPCSSLTLASSSGNRRQPVFIWLCNKVILHSRPLPLLPLLFLRRSRVFGLRGCIPLQFLWAIVYLVTGQLGRTGMGGGSSQVVTWNPSFESAFTL